MPELCMTYDDPFLVLDPNQSAGLYEFERHLCIYRDIAEWEGLASTSSKDHLLAKTILGDIEMALQSIGMLKRTRWMNQRLNNFVRTYQYSRSWRSLEPLSFLCNLVAGTLHLLAHLSELQSYFTMSGIKLLLHQTLMASTKSPEEQDDILSSIPTNIRQTNGLLGAEPSVKAFLCCPKCYKTYRLEDPGSYPEFCDFRVFPGDTPCHRRLRSPSQGGIALPVHQFLYQDLQQWIGRMYPHPDIEKFLDRYRSQCSRDSGDMEDIWDGSVLWEFSQNECKLELDDAENLQFDAWPKRTYDEHVGHARSWKQAGDSNTREKLFNQHQVRWSEFLRLPYWDPTRFITINSMHGFYLGLFQRHICKIWGMDVRLREGEEFSVWRKDGVPTPDELAEGHRAYLGGHLKGLRCAILIQLCRDLGLNYSGGSTALVDQLNKHRAVFPEHIQHLQWADQPVSDPGDDHISINTLFNTGLKSEIAALNVDTLAQMCASKIGGFTSEYFKALGSTKMVKVLQDKRKELGIISLSGCLKGANKGKSSRKTSPTIVLGRDVLKEIRTDIASRVVPSHVGRAPAHPGEASWGKFTTDQWKIFCTIHLPYTLTCLWGSFKDSQDLTEQRWYKMLQNFLHLVMAVKLATATIQNDRTIQLYEYHMKTYLTMLLELYPGTKISIYQHLSLHFGDQLQCFGPNWAWCCFAFERYNGALQKFNTNNKFGPMEMTMMRSFCKQQNIKALYHPDILPDDCDVADGTHVKDPQDRHVDLLHNDEHIQLQGVLDDELAAKSASYIDVVRCAGHLFTTQKRGLANSSVANSANRSVRHIDKIFKHTHVGEKGTRIMETFAVVRILKELLGPLCHFDHFSEFPHMTGQLVSN
ncbi:hypothetical protein IW261DRAFT_1426209 [Armillaria novae-zelandiae]|uniref:Uncharacterized protein n=1 Tax=Armillaria novae-zelandiae TaxID=153914 RepID=A0AA39NN36_9AGAR|nr:hypothetical protein IW261DRAFT_1426209 [Armillaria novae-zelandiae]